jgi:murein DD-endopeptidase MepM/ murein hydrolase activator NlpD
MEKRHHTVIVVPHARAKLRKWRVTNSQIAAVAAALLLATLASGFICWQYFTQDVSADELTRLRTENEDLRRVNESFEQNIRDLQTKLADFEDRTLKLAIVAGIDPAAEGGGEAGIGGEPTQAAGGRDLGDLAGLDRRADHLAGTLDEVEHLLEERLRWISALPAVAPARGLMTSGFGMRRDPISGARAFHEGVDIAASPGQEVRAPADGLVVRAGRDGGLGKAIHLAHGFGVTTRYGHLSEFAVQAGQQVRRGDLLGYVGSTGRATGYHLHYEVHVDGEPVNPIAYFLDDAG